jgi:GNAT superfamily N-acetyltransferase
MLDETHSLGEFDAARRDGHLWVARAGEQPVGFALVELLDGSHPHLTEVDVHPAHGRQGIGAALVRVVCRWAEPRGPLTLTTFRDLAWNMPFYARLGFEEVAPGSLSTKVARVVRDEASRGLDPTRRVVMRWPSRRG